MATLELVQNDKGYDLTFTIKDAQNQPVDLTNAVVTLLVKKYGATTLKINSTCTPSEPYTDGICTYTVQASDFDVVGRYVGELEVNWTGGKRMTAQDLTIDVVPELGTAA